MPDLFHALRDLAKVMGVSLSLKLAQVEEQLTHARQQLGVLEAKGHDTHVQQRWLAHLSAQAEVLRADRATGQSTLQQASQAVHPFTLVERQAQSSAQVESRLHQAVATLNTLRAPYTARDHPAAVTQFQRQIPGIAALVPTFRTPNGEKWNYVRIMKNMNIIKEKTMAVHVETGTMRGPITYQSYNLDHLGLVAAMIDELGLVEM